MRSAERGLPYSRVFVSCLHPLSRLDFRQAGLKEANVNTFTSDSFQRYLCRLEDWAPSI